MVRECPTIRVLPDADALRRRQLRDFLMACRSRLLPSDVGLPDTRRRRVAGLRRDEVAELVGISADWYRWLESGREMHVSPQLVARVARALRLTAEEELTMYALAIPELHRALLRSYQLNRSTPSISPPLRMVHGIEEGGVSVTPTPANELLA